MEEVRKRKLNKTMKKILTKLFKTSLQNKKQRNEESFFFHLMDLC